MSGQRDLPERVLLVLAPQRSGSTWLFDAVRAHPGISMHRFFDVFGFFGTSKRRYPKDLISCSGKVEYIEVKKKMFQPVPVFNASVSAATPAGLMAKSYSLEKIHPGFLDYEASSFLNKLSELESTSRSIRLIYLVRDPKAVMASFMSYQERNPNWFRKMKGNALSEYMARSYVFMRDVVERFQGLILDYTDLSSTPVILLARIFDWIWAVQNKEEREYNKLVAAEAVNLTSREDRAATGSAFFGQTKGSLDVYARKYADFFERHSVSVDLCYSCYRQILDGRLAGGLER